MDPLEVELERQEFTLLRASGALRPGWCGNLAWGLAIQNISIENGRAVMIDAGYWQAEFALRCPASAQLSGGDVARVLDAGSQAGFSTPIVLTDYEVTRSARWDGCLSLDVEGFDRVGFLAALLRRLAYLSLFPVELRLETHSRRIYDRMLLRESGSAPPERTRHLLIAMLEGITKRTTRDRPADPLGDLPRER